MNILTTNGFRATGQYLESNQDLAFEDYGPHSRKMRLARLTRYVPVVYDAEAPACLRCTKLWNLSYLACRPLDRDLVVL